MFMPLKPPIRPRTNHDSSTVSSKSLSVSDGTLWNSNQSCRPNHCVRIYQIVKAETVKNWCTEHTHKLKVLMSRKLTFIGVSDPLVDFSCTNFSSSGYDSSAACQHTESDKQTHVSAEGSSCKRLDTLHICKSLAL